MKLPFSQLPLRSFLIPIAIAGFCCSCGEKEKEVNTSEPKPEPAPVEEPKILSLLAGDRFDSYSVGFLKGQEPPEGFAGNWHKLNDGQAKIRNGEVQLVSPVRTSCALDTTYAGPFIEYLNEEQMIGRDGKTIYLSYYQTLSDVEADQVAIVEFARGGGNIHEMTQFNTGNDTDPSPAGPFGLRGKRSRDLLIAAPEELNSRENLIVLKIQFRFGDKDRLYYYYNPSPGDEKSPNGAIEADDLSFDRYGMACFGGAKMTFRHLRIADNFESVVADGP